MKAFKLPISLKRLYLFNSLLLFISIALLISIFNKLFKDKLSFSFISILTALTFLFQGEILQGMGIVYWAQSLYMPIFLLQFLLYLNKDKNKFYKISFYLMCILGPYVEWTGFVANGRFFARGYKVEIDFMSILYSYFKSCGLLIIISVATFIFTLI